MRLVVGVTHALARKVRVDLRGTERLVTQELLHRTKVGAVVQEVRREGVTDGVGADLRVQADFGEVLGDLPAHRTAAQAATVLVDEEGRVRFGGGGQAGCGQLLVVHADVVTQGLERVGAQQDQAFLVLQTGQSEVLWESLA